MFTNKVYSFRMYVYSMTLVRYLTFGGPTARRHHSAGSTVTVSCVCMCDHGHASTELIIFTAALHYHAIKPTLMCLTSSLVPVCYYLAQLSSLFTTNLDYAVSFKTFISNYILWYKARIWDKFTSSYRLDKISVHNLLWSVNCSSSPNRFVL